MFGVSFTVIRSEYICLGSSTILIKRLSKGKTKRHKEQYCEKGKSE